MKRNFTLITFLFFFLSAFLKINAQKVRVIDNKGTLRSLNRVTVGSAPHTEPTEGDIWYDTSATSFDGDLTREYELKIYNDGSWIKLSENIYNSDGKLTYHRKIKGAGNNLTFQGINQYRLNAIKIDINSFVKPITLNPSGYNNTTHPYYDSTNYGIIANGPFWGKKAYRDSDGDTGTSGQILSSVSLGTEQGTNWVNANTLPNIYNSNGTLTSDRILTGDSNSLRFNDLSRFDIDGTDFINLESTGFVDIKSGATSRINLYGNTYIPQNLSVLGSYTDSNSSSGTSGQILSSTISGTEWIDTSSLITGEPGSVFFADADRTVTEDNDHFFWDKTNERLYIGAKLSGTNKLNVAGTTRTQGVNNSNGTAGTPSYRFTGDSDTGMYRGGSADHLRFTTGGQEALTINNSQNVGIGINNPDKKLDVNGEVKIRNLPTGAKTDNFIVHNADGELKSINADKIHSVVASSVTSGHEIATHQANDITTSIKETVTNVTDSNAATNVKAIARYTNENGTNQNIEETVTNITDSNSATNVKVIATYTNENGGTPQDIEETVTKIEQVNGSSNPPANPNFGQDKTSDSPGDIKYYNENNPTTNPTRVRVVSTDSGNSLKIGSDGGAYYVGPRIYATGRVNYDGSKFNGINFTSEDRTTYFSSSRRQYYIKLNDSLGTGNYSVTATPYKNSYGGNPRLKIYRMEDNGFYVEIVNLSHDGFTFTVITW